VLDYRDSQSNVPVIILVRKYLQHVSTAVL
jgi:hypothetical protein